MERGPASPAGEVAVIAVTVRLHGALRDPAGGRDRVPVTLPAGADLGRLLDVLADELPGVERRIRDETGAVRRHVNLFVDGSDARHLGGLGVPLRDGGEVLVLPAVSGG